MRLKPALTQEDALRILTVSAAATWGPERAEAIRPQLVQAAEAMAIVGAVEVPDETEPLFGEDIGLDPAAEATVA